MTYGTYAANPTMYDQCPECGGKKTKGALFCRACKHDKAPTWKHCVCGKRIRANSNQCKECYDKERQAVKPLCVDCGKPTKRYSYQYHALRCWPCEVQRRRNHPLRLCEVDGCQNPHQAKGYCHYHYVKFVQGRNRPNYGGGHRGNQTAGLLSQLPCQACGYSKMKSELHRIEPKLGYRAGNMVAVCSRCHDEIERGLTPCPVPLAEEQIRH